MPEMGKVTELERAIFWTVRYFSLFDMPVTATQIWRSLVVRLKTETQAITPGLVSLVQVQHALSTSPWLRERIGQHWGYYFLADQQEAVERRLRRHIIAQPKWQIARHVVWWLSLAPFIRMIAVTGSLALSNTKKDSDLDLLVIVQRGRIWTARLCLLLMSQLLGRRRTHWEVKAPDKVCLNHYLTDHALLINEHNQSLYTAALYTHLIPLTGFGMYEAFQKQNAAWLKQWVVTLPAMHVPSVYAVATGRMSRAWQRFWEKWLMEPIGEFIERAAERVQRQTAYRHAQPGRLGRVVLTNDELAFHPDSKAEMVRQELVSN